MHSSLQVIQYSMNISYSIADCLSLSADCLSLSMPSLKAILSRPDAYVLVKAGRCLFWLSTLQMLPIIKQPNCGDSNL